MFNFSMQNSFLFHEYFEIYLSMYFISFAKSIKIYDNIHFFAKVTPAILPAKNVAILPPASPLSGLDAFSLLNFAIGAMVN